MPRCIATPHSPLDHTQISQPLPPPLPLIAHSNANTVLSTQLNSNESRPRRRNAAPPAPGGNRSLRPFGSRRRRSCTQPPGRASTRAWARAYRRQERPLLNSSHSRSCTRHCSMLSSISRSPSSRHCTVSSTSIITRSSSSSSNSSSSLHTNTTSSNKPGILTRKALPQQDDQGRPPPPLPLRKPVLLLLLLLLPTTDRTTAAIGRPTMRTHTSTRPG